MFNPLARVFWSNVWPQRLFHSSSSQLQFRRQPLLTHSAPDASQEIQTSRDSHDEHPRQSHVRRNELGVQLLSRQLHAQIFGNVSFPAPPPEYAQISKDHLKLHGLDPTQGSVLADTGFTLPPLQGSNISEHFHRIGTQAAGPWLTLCKSFAKEELPPRPDNWHIQSGWTKYYYRPDGSSYFEHVDVPSHDGKTEQMLSFDVETMPNKHPHAVLACAASVNAWYTWISPWLLGESDEQQHLIPLGDPEAARVVIGHNVSYDRGRVLEEYNVALNNNRFVDTMSLHVAVSGISSHQRPAWMKHRKRKKAAAEQRQEALEAVVDLMESFKKDHHEGIDTRKQEDLLHLRQDMEDSLHLLQANGDETSDGADICSKRWEDLTSSNSLADVAKLHCDIEMDKTIRDDFMVLEREQIVQNITDYMEYCANDVYVTHRVFSVILPTFLVTCPHPASFAGILTMGSSFLTVNEEWNRYLERADAVYHAMESGVLVKLERLAEEARNALNDDSWKDDPWLSQLDWTPKVAGKSRGILPPEEETTMSDSDPISIIDSRLPAWYLQLVSDPFAKLTLERLVPILLKLSFKGHPLVYSIKDGWHYLVDNQVVSLEQRKGKRILNILAKTSLSLLDSGSLTSANLHLARALCTGNRSEDIKVDLLSSARSIFPTSMKLISDDPWLSQLDWTLFPATEDRSNLPPIGRKRAKKPKPEKPPPVLWPKWYWEATKPRKDAPPGTLEITGRSRVAPLLLRLSWLGWPLFYSREHGWTFRVPSSADFKTRFTALSFRDPADDALAEARLTGGYIFYKLPHKDGESANVGSPLGKTFISYAQDGTLKSPGNEAEEALEMNAVCSYWISARDRIRNQTIVWQNDQFSLGLPSPVHDKPNCGIIIPQVVTMGTVTRRAIEKTWLTASNAKKNRVGSELKAMVRAPDGYAIVGADVDSEELWISSCMGDAQFGLHGASAIGWMTLEGTKAAGTDLHSKTAAILGITRDQAKVFNYSRIYGAGMRHAILLLLQSNPSMLPEEAERLAENLYASTKGKNTHRTDIFERKFWFGGTESYLFNKLEEIALSDKPQTPALGCGVTYALSKDNLPEGFGLDYMPSRINWVVQSSGVDYLHLLIVSMTHLIEKYDIKARYLISVHDEVRYLVVEEDKYRAALALQIANLWTRSLFAFKLGMDDLPQGVAFFSAVDIDKVLRKEADMPCVTPSHPTPLPPGESLDIEAVLAKTNGGSLRRNGLPMSSDPQEVLHGCLDGYIEPDCLAHRSPSAAFLLAQASTDFMEIKGLAGKAYGVRFSGGPNTKSSRQQGPRWQHKDDSELVDDWFRATHSR